MLTPADGTPETEGKAGKGKRSVVITNPGDSSPGEQAPTNTQRVSRKGPSRPLPKHVIRRTYAGTAPDGSPCRATEVTRRDTPMTPAELAANAGGAGAAGVRGIPACPPAVGSGLAPAPTPAQVAEAFLREVPLPAPAPRIAPNGTAITGLAAFLETNGTLSHTMGPGSTPLGPIVVEATSVYWVDWGDGTPEAGPFAFEGEAYPTGRIWHGYTERGDYTVTVRQAWTANWRLGAESGTVEGLATEASVALDVDEVQAVIRR